MPDEVSTELQRVVERWRQLPLDHALRYAGRVHALVQHLADDVAKATGRPAAAVPDLGPGSLMDQLTVMLYDAGAAHVGARAVTSAPISTRTSTLAEDLVRLRTELR